jgi:hypothetical protein
MVESPGTIAAAAAHVTLAAAAAPVGARGQRLCAVTITRLLDTLIATS